MPTGCAVSMRIAPWLPSWPGCWPGSRPRRGTGRRSLALTRSSQLAPGRVADGCHARARAGTAASQKPSGCWPPSVWTCSSSRCQATSHQLVFTLAYRVCCALCEPVLAGVLTGPLSVALGSAVLLRRRGHLSSSFGKVRAYGACLRPGGVEWPGSTQKNEPHPECEATTLWGNARETGRDTRKNSASPIRCDPFIALASDSDCLYGFPKM
jgi:hypothetical protein